jgi:hypothetical protein
LPTLPSFFFLQVLLNSLNNNSKDFRSEEPLQLQSVLELLQLLQPLERLERLKLLLLLRQDFLVLE